MKNLLGRLATFLSTPTGVIVAANAVWHLATWFIGFRSLLYYVVSLFIIGFDIFAASFLRDKLIHFFSQFTLPVQNEKDRAEIAARVKNFESGSRGPAMFVKNGRVILHESETKRRGPGLIALDTASALVLRTDTEIRDTVGPGVKFTKSNEYIAGSIDLRAQWQFIGPHASDQPFLNPISSPKEYNESLSRRQQTCGLTRDGFEVAPTLSIRFSVKRPAKLTPTPSGVTSRYGFDPDAVRNAITREVVQLGTSQNVKSRMAWNELPAHLVVNVWREYIRKFKFSDLFTPMNEEGKSGLQIIEEAINRRVKQENVEALDETGARTGEWVESLEFKQLERRGLQIAQVRIHNILFEPALEQQIIEQWSADWMDIASKEKKQLEDMESLIDAAARNEASKNFARIASQQFSAKTSEPQDNPFKTLQLLVQPLKEFIVSESDAGHDVDMELRKLEEVWKWLLDNNSAQGAEMGGGQG
ncbi:MAG: hypothetical protein LDL50_02625 [Chloroflexi bacterium]|nr:hypothetical protein [Chloroflexota bacterium]MCA2002625.1 hypothetical protein [Chloroflexota bacterium]